MDCTAPFAGNKKPVSGALRFAYSGREVAEMGKKGFFVICMAVLCLLCAAALAADPEYWVLIRPGSEGSTEANFGYGMWFTSANGTIASSFVTAKDGQFFRDEDGNMHIKVSDYYSPEWITPADGYVFNGWEAVEGAERAEGAEENDPSDFKLTAQSAIIQARWSKSWFEYWITRENSANTCAITGANYDLNKVTEIFLPATINGLTVNRFDVSLEGLRDLSAVMIYKDFSIGRLPSFKNCKSLKNIHTVNHMGIISRKDTLPDSITEIGAGTFAGTKIMRLDMPNVERVVTGVSGAFESCNSLQSVTFGKAASIDSRAFSNISKTGIECTVTYPGTKANWSWDAFMYSPNLLVECNDGSCGWCGDQWTTEMEMYGGSCVHWTQDLNGNLTVDSFGSAEDLYENRKTAQIVRSHNAIPLNAKTLTIKHVYGIDDNAFRNQQELTKVSLPEDLTSIGSRAFFDCTALTS
ncbi:MAG: leucine-rich repeat protein, partial [Oscillospiraceae bacterium]|nr:leucine-rich repeat protein [Oscillospiraceae bacterium]